MKRALAVIAVCFVLVGAVVAWLSLLDPFGAEAAAKARASAVLRYAETTRDGTCATRRDIEAAAEAEGWQVTEIDAPRFCHAPLTRSGWVRITVTPPLPFSAGDENAIFEAFDAQGCRQEWRYTSC